MQKNMQNVTFIIFGVTGDLSKRKLIPAIYHLIQHHKLEKFAIIGVARKNIEIKSILKYAKKFVKKSKPSIWKKIEKNAHYFQLDFTNKDGYSKLSAELNILEKKNKLKGNRLFYFATSPEYFIPISSNISEIVKEKNGWCRMVYEKPFGNNLHSAKKINKCLDKVFKESQIFRVDHYLGKELVGNISLARFTNRILEPLWNRKHIESIDIIMEEKLDVQGRAIFYDKYGALKDVVQNHLLQLLSLVAMEPPKNMTGKEIRKGKSKVLKKIKIVDVNLGQYQGYKKERGVMSNSNTDTFVDMTLEVDNARWYNVPFHIRTGKALQKKETKIIINFKKVKCLLDYCPSKNNQLIINIDPKRNIIFGVNTKIPEKNEVLPVEMEFCYSCKFGPNTPKAYSNLFKDIIKGDQTVFVSKDEIESSWKIIDKIKKPKLKYYKKGSDGPK